MTKNFRWVLGALCAVALAGGGAFLPAQAAPAPTYGATLAATSDCGMVIQATWKQAKVGRIYAVLYMPNRPVGQDTITQEAPGNVPLRGGRATFAYGPFLTSPDLQPWSARVDFYSAAGAQLHQEWVPAISAPCTVAALG